MNESLSIAAGHLDVTMTVAGAVRRPSGHTGQECSSVVRYDLHRYVFVPAVPGRTRIRARGLAGLAAVPYLRAAVAAAAASLNARSRRNGRGPSASDDVLVISDSRENTVVADPTVTADGARTSYVSGARLILRTGLVVSIGLAFIFFLDRRTTNMLIFAFLAFVFFVLLARTPARPRSTMS